MRNIKITFHYIGYIPFVYGIILPVLFLVNILNYIKMAVMDEDREIRDSLHNQKMFNRMRITRIKQGK